MSLNDESPSESELRSDKFLSLEKFLHFVSVSIKDVDETAFTNLKAEAARRGMRVGEAASEAFRTWVSSKRITRVRDSEMMRDAAEDMDRIRTKYGKADWSGVAEIRKWRDQRRR